jgi:hypothetical protein
MFTIQRACAWSAIVCIVLFFLAFTLSGFIPPPSPSLPQADVVAYYQQHATGIRTGMLILMIGGMFLLPTVGLISHHMRRIPNLPVALPYAQVSLGATNAMFFFIPAVMFLVTAYRPDRPPELTYLMNDMSFIFAVLPWPPAFMESAVIAVAILADTGAKKIFPRWVGWLNVWVALAFVPASLMVFVKSGPFAWNGVITFFLAGTMFLVWFVIMTWALLKAVTDEESQA